MTQADSQWIWSNAVEIDVVTYNHMHLLDAPCDFYSRLRDLLRLSYSFHVSLIANIDSTLNPMNVIVYG